eukprot:s845_g21.t1
MAADANENTEVRVIETCRRRRLQAKEAKKGVQPILLLRAECLRTLMSQSFMAGSCFLSYCRQGIVNDFAMEIRSTEIQPSQT